MVGAIVVHDAKVTLPTVTASPDVDDRGSTPSTAVTMAGAAVVLGLGVLLGQARGRRRRTGGNADPSDTI